METKQKIIQAMGQLFSEKGYMASMSEVSKKVGIKVPSIYSHFESKDQIIYLVLEEEISSYLKFLIELQAKLKGESTETILEKIYFEILDYYRDHTRLRIIKNIELIPDGPLYRKCNALQKENMSKHINSLAIIFEEGYKNKEIRVGTDEGYHYLYLTMIQGILNGPITFDEHPEVTKVYEKKVWKVFWNSIKAKED